MQPTAVGAPAHEGARRRGRGDRAVALVEFAVLLPFLAVLVFGTVDLGRAYQLQNRLKNAAREGAAFAQSYPLKQTNTGACANPDNIPYRAQRELGDGTGTGFTVTVDKPTACNVRPVSGSLDPGQTITVTVAKDFRVIAPLIGAIVGNPVTISESVTVVIQG